MSKQKDKLWNILADQDSFDKIAELFELLAQNNTRVSAYKCLDYLLTNEDNINREPEASIVNLLYHNIDKLYMTAEEKKLLISNVNSEHEFCSSGFYKNVLNNWLSCIPGLAESEKMVAQQAEINDSTREIVGHHTSKLAQPSTNSSVQR